MTTLTERSVRCGSKHCYNRNLFQLFGSGDGSGLDHRACCRALPDFATETDTHSPHVFGLSCLQQLVARTRVSDKLDAVGGDSAVARLDAQRRTVLPEIEEKAVRFIELKLGVMSAARALTAYRERHRSGMMAQASDAFALITRGQYTGLTTQPAKTR